jgi:hypothetical protein
MHYNQMYVDNNVLQNLNEALGTIKIKLNRFYI